ncbi:iron reductase [Salmonella enterica subsp. enterica]|nr:iron reductase [Salmonella enterica subsp. enterica serovar Typhimurium]EHP3225863.1 ferric reductase-like transmembrane domain-containing protein [Salmonella enterica subsp. enterica serovar Newport]
MMRKITYLGIATFLTACLIYLIPQLNILLSTYGDGWLLRKEFILFSGVVAWLFMTLAMVLSLRLPVLESITGGLDKGFILHKWAGIITLTTGLLHWMMKVVPKWLAQQGWITPQQKIRHMAGTAPEWSIELASTGQTIAEWAIYILIILCIISLSKKVPYHLFRYIHKIFPMIYLSMTFHTLTILSKTSWWSSPSLLIILLLAGIGTVSAFISLFQLIGKKRKILATVIRAECRGDTIDITLQSEKPLHYRSGQFAFVRFGNNPEQHPYTIASSPVNPLKLRFVIKALGDDTRHLVETLTPGVKAEVEGPYGCFDFECGLERQIWVAGGIGITPFLSRLTTLAQQGGAETPTELWYCGRQEPSRELTELCSKAKVRLHTVDTRNHERLNSGILLQTISPDEKAGVWFCGPASFRRILHRDMKKRAVPFQYDNFSLR